MNVLGLHFGHDAGVVVLRDGRVASFVLRERFNRVKHACSVDVGHIDYALADAGIGIDDLDCCAIVSTQNYELLIDDRLAVSLSPQAHPDDPVRSPLRDLFHTQGIDINERLVGSVLNYIYDDTRASSIHRDLFPEYRTRNRADIRLSGYLMDYVHSELWNGRPTLNDISATNFLPLLDDDTVRLGMHYPFTLTLRGRAMPAYMVQHHTAHASSVYYLSEFDHAAILTHDGAISPYGHNNGMFFWGEGQQLTPLSPHHLVVGALYSRVGERLGWDLHSAAGKLMGLAPYGKPRFFEQRFVGNAFDLATRGIDDMYATWWAHCIDRARALRYDLEPLGDTKRVMAPIAVDIAASTQTLMEEVMRMATATLRQILVTAGLPADRLCYSGGTALNCPTNSRMFRESGFEAMFVEPCCDDSGLALGAALYVCHNLYEQPLPPRRVPGAAVTPYFGPRYDEASIECALREFASAIVIERIADPAAAAAQDLAQNRILGWFEGRSELGPRALGHRSLLVDPRISENWARVNRVKGREHWRPFAPSVLEEEAAKWFAGCPFPSSYMLFTAAVTTSALPAITHVDGSSRIQTVTPECGMFYRVLFEFNRLTGVPVILNTSFNGPAEPIVESPQHALRFLVESDLDVLYLDGIRVTRVI